MGKTEIITNIPMNLQLAISLNLYWSFRTQPLFYRGRLIDSLKLLLITQFFIRLALYNKGIEASAFTQQHFSHYSDE